MEIFFFWSETKLYYVYMYIYAYCNTWIKLLDFSIFFQCHVTCTSCIFSGGYIDSDHQPPTGFRSDWWKDLRLWRCRPQIGTSMFPGCFKDVPGFSTMYLNDLNNGKHTGFGEVWTKKLAESDFEEATQIDATKIRWCWFDLLKMCQHDIDFVEFSDNYEIWEILKTPATCIWTSRNIFGSFDLNLCSTAIWTRALTVYGEVGHSRAGSGWKPGGQSSKFACCCHVLRWPPMRRSSRWCFIYTRGCIYRV